LVQNFQSSTPRPQPAPTHLTRAVFPTSTPFWHNFRQTRPQHHLRSTESHPT
jgi:hypothetical protein